MNVTCSICTEVFLPAEEVNTTLCGHMFHRHCMLRWLEQSQNCPQCRKHCTEAQLIKMYLNGTDEANATGSNSDANGSLFQKLNNLTLKMSKQEQLFTALRNDAVEHKTEQKKMSLSLQAMEENLRAKNEEVLAMSRVETERNADAVSMRGVLTVNIIILPETERISMLRSPSIDLSDLLFPRMSYRRLVDVNTSPNFWEFSDDDDD